MLKNTRMKLRKIILRKIRAHLRGFYRTILSLIMACGDHDLTLQNFDDYTEDEVFADLESGISSRRNLVPTVECVFGKNFVATSDPGVFGVVAPLF